MPSFSGSGSVPAEPDRCGCTPTLSAVPTWSRAHFVSTWRPGQEIREDQFTGTHGDIQSKCSLSTAGTNPPPLCILTPAPSCSAHFIPSFLVSSLPFSHPSSFTTPADPFVGAGLHQGLKMFPPSFKLGSFKYLLTLKAMMERGATLYESVLSRRLSRDFPRIEPPPALFVSLKMTG